jgi:hypothetical protein
VKVFISWSGKRSEAMAKALYHWLPDVINAVEPFMSAEDIRAGSRWLIEIAEQLQDTHFGILCVTRENPDHAWLLFEAGAIAKNLQSHVIPLMLDYTRPTELPAGPLSHFQGKLADEAGVRDVVDAINETLAEHSGTPLDPDRVKRSFDRAWPDLLEQWRKIPAAESTPSPPAADAVPKMTEEILETVRAMSRVLGRIPLDNPTPDTRDEVRNKRTMELTKRLMAEPEIQASKIDALTVGYFREYVYVHAFRNEQQASASQHYPFFDNPDAELPRVIYEQIRQKVIAAIARMKPASELPAPD